MRRALLPLLAVLLGAPALPLAAQAADALEPGMRVRVLAPPVHHRPLRGEVLAATADTLRLAWRGDTLAIARGSVRRVEVSRGRSRGLGAVLGAGVGLLAGGAAGALLCDTDPGCARVAVGPFLSGFAGAVVGTPVGGVVGYAVGRERWWTVPELSRAATGVAPRGAGVALAVHLTH